MPPDVVPLVPDGDKWLRMISRIQREGVRVSEEPPMENFAMAPDTGLIMHTQAGRVVRSTQNIFVLKDAVGDEHSYSIAVDAARNCDGRPCTAEQIKAGMKVNVTTKQDSATVASRIDAINHFMGR